jgi:hypothetical protein
LPLDKNAQGGLTGLKLPTTKRDLESLSSFSRSDFAAGLKSDSFYERVGAGPLYKRKQMDTPHSELSNYLNWVPQKEKLNMAAIQKAAK